MSKKKSVKKKSPPKKISKTEQVLRDALYYARRARKPIEKEINKVLLLDANKMHLYKGKKRNKKTILNLLLEDAKRVNNKITPIEKKLERFKYKIKRKYKVLDDFDKGKGEYFWSGAKIWQRKDAETHLNSVSKFFKSLQGISLKNERDKADSLLNSVFSKMDSKQTLCFYAEKNSKNLQILVINKNDKDEESE